MIPPRVGANAVLKPTTPITTNAVPVITTVLRRLRCRRSPSSPTSRKPTAIVMTKTSKPAMITHRLLARTWAVIRVRHLLNRLETDYGPGLAWVSRATRFGGGVLSSTRRSRFARYRFGEELIEQGLSGAHTTAGIPIDPEGGGESKALAGPDVQQDVVGKGSLHPGVQVVGKDPWSCTWRAVRVGRAVEEEPC